MKTKNLLIIVVFLTILLLIINKNTPNNKHKEAFQSNLSSLNQIENQDTPEHKRYREITGNIKKGETLFDIFKKYKLDFVELFHLRKASANIHKLKDVYPGRPYKIIIDDNSHIKRFTYWIDDDSILNITRTEEGFSASKKNIEYETKILHIGGIIKDNLIDSMGQEKETLLLALQLSDIFAWDIDFTTDLRKGDIFKLVVESCYLNNKFKKYGNILAAEFINNKQIYHAFRFEHNGEVDYYDDDGKSLRRAFLKAPLSFRRISSRFSKRRYHPILKIYRPHLGVDYAAPTGTPVSSVGDGTITFAGYKGQNGKIVMIRHPNSFRTYYGHLSRIKKGMKRGVKVKQGQIIGYVGTTGLSTGPHLDYRIKKHNRFVNPLTLNLPRGESLPKTAMADFTIYKDKMNVQLASITPPTFALADQKKEDKKI
jgi:murein DD-endopeptidase MepM/ murein hydrolase activator NlpD